MGPRHSLLAREKKKGPCHFDSVLFPNRRSRKTRQEGIVAKKEGEEGGAMKKLFSSTRIIQKGKEKKLGRRSFAKVEVQRSSGARRKKKKEGRAF